MKKNYETGIAFGVFFLFMIGVFLFSYLSYHSEKAMLYTQIDARLKAAAQGQTLLLTPDFHDRTLNVSSISKSEDVRNIKHLSQFAKTAGVLYVYTMIERNGRIYFTASSATDEELRSQNKLTHYFDWYEDVSPAIRSVFRKQKTIYDETPDKWGTFRSIIIPMRSPNGDLYAAGADLLISDIKAMLDSQAQQHFIFAFGLLIISFISLLWRLSHIKKLSFYDALTGLPNRIELTRRANYILASAKRNHDPCSIMFLDLDHFKEINDTLGHNIGDELLIQVAKRIRSVLRKVDTASRMGGDEFILLLAQTDSNGAGIVSQKLLDIIAEPYHVRQHELTISTSIGISIYPIDGHDFETLSKNADSAMYLAKNEGRHSYRFFTTELQKSAQRHLLLLNALHHAMEQNEFQLYYQPQVSLHDGHIIGAEALLRWNNPELGSISPVEFIPIAEESGLIINIGEWVMRTAMHQAKQWEESNLAPMIIAINLSAVQFRHPNFTHLVSKILEEIGLLPEYIELELTESTTMHDPQQAINIMNDLYYRGIRMSIDDFGTGYSSLSYLKKFNIYKLKIDKSFVNDITTDHDDKAIVGAIISMAHSLGLQVIAEGVETLEQLCYLKEQGCDEIQGYYYSQPINAKEFEFFVKDHLTGIKFQSDTKCTNPDHSH